MLLLFYIAIVVLLPTLSLSVVKGRLTDQALVPNVALVLLALFFALLSFRTGIIITRIVRYNGQGGPLHKRHDIVPQYLKERYITARESNLRRSSTETRLPAPPMIEIDNLTEEELRDAIAEEERIMRLPTFIQDDCGDGENFPDVPLADHRTISTLESAPRRGSGVNTPSYVQMGLHKLDPKTWLTVDNTYADFHAARSELLEYRKEEVLRVSPEGEQACKELMKEVVDFLVKTYPQYFEIVGMNGTKGKKVKNKIIGEEFALQCPFDVHPLEMCARLAMEDFNILMKSELTGKHIL